MTSNFTDLAPERIRPTDHTSPAPRMVSYFTHGITLAYRTYGHGPSVVIAFHGFGRTGADFEVLTKTLGEACTIHAFDLHFHGKSPSYPERASTPFTPHELAVFFTAFLDSMTTKKATVLGYSLGGRIALSLLTTMPERFERLILVAPDGLKTRPWYRALAATQMGEWAYRRFVEHPEKIHLFMDGLRATRLMSQKMHRFLKGQTDSQAKRMLVRDVWLSFRSIEPDLEEVAAIATARTIPINIFFGKFDSVIKPRFGKKLHDLAPDVVSQENLPFGHVLLVPELGKALAELFPIPVP
ncbi:MAG: alpha/beta hydrolase [Flavobacteriales bacterium]|nr:alpha/beta hydrolase [Flavobacteriales bacterium]